MHVYTHICTYFLTILCVCGVYFLESALSKERIDEYETIFSVTYLTLTSSKYDIKV